MKLFKRKPSKREMLDKTETNEYKLGFLDAMNLYTRLIADKITKGRNDNPMDKLEGNEVLGDGNFYYSVNRIFTDNGIKKPYFVHLPEYIDRGFLSDVRNDIEYAVNRFNLANQMEENVSVTVIADAEHYDVDLSQGRMQGRFRMWAKQYERISKKAQNRKLEDELNSDKHSDATRHKVGSYLYMKEAVETQKASFFKTNIIIELVATSDEVLDEADKVLRASFQKNIEYKEVFIQTNEYMKSFSPMTNVKDTLIRRMNTGNVYADETISSLTVPTHGVVGDEKGQYYGVDILSNRVVTIDMLSGSNAHNVLLTAKTSEGKSMYAKMLYTFYPMNPQFSTVVYDYEGTEYTPLANIINANIISLTSASGRFVNTMVIGELTGDDEIDENLKADAQEATVKIFHILVDEYDGMSQEQLPILSLALKEVYGDYGVTEDKKTWKNSKDITFFHVYQKIKDFLNHPKYDLVRQKYDERTLNTFVNILSPYFEEGELYKHWFKESITVQELLDDKHVVFNFGMGRESESMVNTKSLALRQMFASHITTLLANHNKTKEVKTVIFLEELQRYLQHRYSGEIIAKFTSGGRKLGMITYLITNSPSMMLDLKDNYDDEIRKNVKTIMSNVTMTIIGALYKSDMDELIENFSLHDSRGVLYQLSEVAEANSNINGLKYCFHLRVNGQSTIVRMLTHPALDDLPLYKTIDMKESKDTSGLRTVEYTDKDKIGEELEKANLKDKEMRQKGSSFRDYQKESSNAVW